MGRKSKPKEQPAYFYYSLLQELHAIYHNIYTILTSNEKVRDKYLELHEFIFHDDCQQVEINGTQDLNIMHRYKIHKYLYNEIREYKPKQLTLAI